MSSVHMRKQSRKRGELLWPRMMMKKWLNISSTGDEFSADEFSADEHEDTDHENESDSENEDTKPRVPKSYMTRNFSPSRMMEGRDAVTKRASDMLIKREVRPSIRHQLDVEELRIAVGTWNVAGRTPTPCMDLHNWLQMDDPADIYVVGFQEIVPLNAGNVFGAEDNGPTLKWQTLIRETLNRKRSDNNTCYSAPQSPTREPVSSEGPGIYSGDAELDDERVLIDEGRSFISPYSTQSMEGEDDQMESTRLDVQKNGDVRRKEGLIGRGRKAELSEDGQAGKPKFMEVYRCTESIGLNRARHQRTTSEPLNWLTVDLPLDGMSTDEESLVRGSLSPIRSNPARKRIRYVCVASKQMVGIHISVWIRRKLRQYIRNLTVSCVGLGLMGCLGNKGSISVSMVLDETSFCFICTHLSSGEKEGDELHRNADVAEILKRTRFPYTKSGDTNVPKTICGHHRIIWFGDMNYRLNLSDSKVRFLVAREDWMALLGEDQLRKELSRGHVFDGWHEGPISFPPTYKYKMNSNLYFGERAKPGEKRRAPAWCDRILWYGKGLKQLLYRREELKLSDHRPVTALFLAEVKICGEHKFKKALSFKNTKFEVEELLSLIKHPTSGVHKVHPEERF